ncbi:MAG: transporter substrate-binding domain-containing protein, partial [Deltaproteobacteria bacterium]|nr:transporter substrate-binding domain-containing protein [Deltaproteobacteria bacterium]
VRARGKLLVGIDTGEPPGDGTPPMFFPDAAGNPDGFDYHVAKWIATAVGVPDVELVHGKYSELPALLVDKQQFDVIVSGYTPSDESGVSWSNGYLDFGLCLVVTQKSPIMSTADLWGKQIGIFDDDAAAEEVQKMVKGFTGLTRMEDGYWDALADGKFDAFIYDYPYTVAELKDWYKDNPSRANLFRIAQYNLTDSHYAAGVRQSEPELLAAVNEGIKLFMESTHYGEAVRRYLSGGTKVDAPASAARLYVVKPGDSLSKIAAQELGNAAEWRTLWTLNKERFPNPNLIEVGDQVVMPS